MLKDEHIRIMPEGQVYIEYGPTAMLVAAYNEEGKPLTDLCRNAFKVLRTGLAQIAEALPLLRRRPDAVTESHLQGLPLAMCRAVRLTGEPTLTPMAAVAGSLADTVADWLADQGAAVAVANNGGDVALRLAPGQSLRLRTVIDLRTGETSQPALIQAGAGIGGICTSGLGGRSFTRGIAESVTVFAARANVADALATHLANCSFIDSPRVASTLAVNLDPQTDIPELEVVTATDILPEEELHRAITQVLEEAGRQYSAGLLIRMEGSIQGRRFAFPGNAVHEP